MQSVQWDDITAAFAPFQGTAIGAVRADTFFNLSNPKWSGWRYRAKCHAYPLLLLRRAVPTQALAPIPNCDVLFLSDYSAEAGFGTLKPLLSAGAKIGFIGTHDVIRSRGHELRSHGNVSCISIDSLALSRGGNLLRHWRQAKRDFGEIIDAAPYRCRAVLMQSRPLVHSLLVRAYLYETALREIIDRSCAKAIVLHNDFTTVSNIAVSLSRKLGIAECTLQHGFPSLEYFPTSSSRYLVWGMAFADYMKSAGATSGAIEVVGAPRLDAIASRHSQAAPRIGTKPRALFLSQTHTHLFSQDEHRRVLQMLENLCNAQTCCISVRLHPQEDGAIYKSFPLLSRTIASGGSLTDSVDSADVIVSVNSTALLEAMLLKKPCLQLYSPEMEDRLGILRLKASARSTQELEQLVRETASPACRELFLAEQSQLVERYVFQPGRGSENAWNAILSAAKPEEALAG